MSKIPLVDLGAQQAEIADEVRAGLDEVFAATAFIGGPAVGRFEAAYSAFSQVSHTIGVANGTDALELALRAAGVRAGGEVIIPANTFIATAEAASRIGAVPVLVDVDPVHLLMDPDAVRAAVGPRTEAIVPVHLFGQVAPVEEIGKIAADAGVPMIEDAAQSQGATRNGRAAGSFGLAAGTSFYPGKNLGAAGDAGAVTTSDADIARTVRVLSAHGSAVKYQHEAIGMNSRLDTVQAVVLEAKLRRLEGWNDARRAAAARYGELLAGVDGVRVPVSAEGNQDVWHLYVVQVDDRDRVLRELNDAGIGAGIHYPTPVHLTGAYGGLGLGVGAFQVTEAAALRILSLPMYPHLTVAQQERVAEQLRTSVG
ncbi:DegT/DnrJ/EryC1/StrS family aminotransferase [Cellulomonas sp. McL0617]|uniref:DegT/DnrJ/EryC1/StrS family aminotransferase n=1 Tax=Cellulomonas sp. McL0617 TaxID=3415675 RepID=UPI003CF5E4D4